MSKTWRLLPQWEHLTLDEAIRSVVQQRTGRVQRALADGIEPTPSDIADDVESLFEVVSG